MLKPIAYQFVSSKFVMEEKLFSGLMTGSRLKKIIDITGAVGTL